MADPADLPSHSSSAVQGKQEIGRINELFSWWLSHGYTVEIDSDMHRRPGALRLSFGRAVASRGLWETNLRG